MSTIDDLEVYTAPLEHTDDGKLRQIICDIPIESPPFPPVKEIVGWDLPQEEQFWANIYEKIKLPASFKKIQFDKEGNPLNTTTEQDAIIETHIERRKNGFWWYNNGQPTWITGTHYMYVVFWRLDTGIPEYRDPDRKYFWFWWFCENDPDCYGMQELGKRQSGKCFAKDTLVRMYDGTVKMVQDIQEGELVMGNDSTPRIVSGVTSGREEMFKITPYSGESFSCNKSHILSLYYNKPGYNQKHGWNGRSHVNVSLEKYLTLTKNEKKHLCLYHEGWGDHFKPIPHFIPPYLLGLYLGDGSKASGNITNIDPEIALYLKEWCDDNDLILIHDPKRFYYRLSNKNGAGKKAKIVVENKELIFNTLKEIAEYAGIPNDHIYRNTGFVEKYKFEFIETSQTNKYRDELKRLNVLNNKHIPEEYLKDSKENRLELLAGLIDTDGYLCRHFNGKTFNYEIVQKDKSIADGIVELAKSLGLYVNCVEKIATMKRKDRSQPKYECLVYRMTISGQIDQIPVRIERKKIEKYTQRNNKLNTGFNFESGGEGEYYGFAVNQNHLFLLASGIVVHNSAKAGICIFDRCTKGYFRMGGIQSKNDRDATSFFTKFIVRGWKFLPFFFSPLFQGTTSPRRKLEFISPSKKGKKAMVDGQVDAVDELGSIIEARPAKELAFDGESLFMYISDEGGKTPLSEANVETRWNIVKECLTFNGDIRGKALHPSTAEEMEKGGAAIFKSMWVKSKYADKDPETGRTESGLYRYFIPAYQNLKLDKFGFAMEEISKAKIEADIAQIKDTKQRLSAWRKNPFTVKDAFKTGGKDCAFNAALLLHSIERAEQQTDLWEDFSLDWEQQVGEGGIIKKRDTKIIATPVKGGRFHFRLLNMPRGIDANKVKKDVFGKLRPDNNLVFSGAVDSYDTIDPKTKKFSKGSVTAFQKFDPNIDAFDKPMGEWLTNRYVVWYKERPVGGPEVFYEDMIMLAHFLGIELLIEDDKPGLYHYFLKRGYEHFCAYKPESAKSSTELASGKETVNISSRILVKQAYFGHIDQYIINYHELIDCIPIAEDWLDMEFDNMTPYDLGVASGLNQLQNNKYIRMERPVQQGLSFVRMYDRAGNELGVKQ